MRKLFHKSLNYQQTIEISLKRNAKINDILNNPVEIVAELKLVSMGHKYCKFSIEIDPELFVFKIAEKESENDLESKSASIINGDSVYTLITNKELAEHELLSLTNHPITLEVTLNNANSIAISSSTPNCITSTAKHEENSVSDNMRTKTLSVKEILQYEPPETASMDNIQTMSEILHDIKVYLSKGLQNKYTMEDLYDKQVEVEYTIEQHNIRMNKQ